MTKGQKPNNFILLVFIFTFLTSFSIACGYMEKFEYSSTNFKAVDMGQNAADKDKDEEEVEEDSSEADETGDEGSDAGAVDPPICSEAIEIIVADASADEGSGASPGELEFTVSIDKVALADIEIPLSTADGTVAGDTAAVAGSDYLSPPGFLLIENTIVPSPNSSHLPSVLFIAPTAESAPPSIFKLAQG